DLRLTTKGRELGLVDERRWSAFCAKREAIEHEQARLDATWVSPQRVPEATATAVLGQALRKEQRLSDLLRRPGVSYARLMQLPGVGPGVTEAAVIAQIEIRARYSGYIERQQ